VQFDKGGELRDKIQAQEFTLSDLKENADKHRPN
jgi:hypothetical protein